MRTGEGLVSYAKEYLGTPYFYGAKIPEGILTENKMKIMHTMYPKIVTAAYMKKARDRGQVGKVNVDCSGLIAGYRQRNLGSAQLYQTAYTRMPMARLADFAPGVVLWKPGHVGVYMGRVDGTAMCIEAKGIHYGTVQTRVSATKWRYGLTFADLLYDYDTKVPGIWKGIHGENPYKEPELTVTIVTQAGKKGIQNYLSRGEGVKWLQWELSEAGFLQEKDIDGICGPRTVTAILAYQRSCKITEDGLAGKTTRKYLAAA